MTQRQAPKSAALSCRQLAIYKRLRMAAKLEKQGDYVTARKLALGVK